VIAAAAASSSASSTPATREKNTSSPTIPPFCLGPTIHNKSGESDGESESDDCIIISTVESSVAPTDFCLTTTPPTAVAKTANDAPTEKENEKEKERKNENGEEREAENNVTLHTAPTGARTIAVQLKTGTGKETELEGEGTGAEGTDVMKGSTKGSKGKRVKKTPNTSMFAGIVCVCVCICDFVCVCAYIHVVLTYTCAHIRQHTTGLLHTRLTNS